MKAIVASYLEIQGRLAVDKFEGVQRRRGDRTAGDPDGDRRGGDRQGRESGRGRGGFSRPRARLRRPQRRGDRGRKRGRLKDLPDSSGCLPPDASGKTGQKEDAIGNPYYGSMTHLRGD